MMTLPLVWPDLLTLDPDRADLDWQPFGPGIELLPLQGTPPQGGSCALLRYRPGARGPHHCHEGLEHLLILRGSQSDDRGHYRAGSFIINLPGSCHQVSSPEGCLVLAIWSGPVRFLSG